MKYVSFYTCLSKSTYHKLLMPLVFCFKYFTRFSPILTLDKYPRSEILYKKHFLPMGALGHCEARWLDWDDCPPTNTGIEDLPFGQK
jgi:hypothetical protein